MGSTWAYPRNVLWDLVYVAHEINGDMAGSDASSVTFLHEGFPHRGCEHSTCVKVYLIQAARHIIGT